VFVYSNIKWLFITIRRSVKRLMTIKRLKGAAVIYGLEFTQ